MDKKKHLEMFADAFVLKDRRDRWRGFLSKHKRRNHKLSSDLFNHLDKSCITQNDELIGVAQPDESGVFYDFIDNPKVLSFEEARNEGENSDAIFSLKKGKLAIYFFHEGWNYVCER